MMNLDLCVVAILAFAATALANGIDLDRPMRPPNATWSCSDAPSCGTQMACHNGCCAYSNGPSDQCTGNSCGGDGSYGYKYQCVELGQRCFSQWYGTTKIWYDNANMFCDKYPSGVEHTATPAAGDLMVFSWAPYGHVTVITAVDGSNIHVIEQNSSPNGKNVYQLGSQQCFLRAVHQPPPGPKSMCSGVPDGWYCGGDMISGGNANTLYFCSGGQMTSSKACSNGACAVVPSANDKCVPGTCSSSQVDGWYCGNDGIADGESNILYFCRNHVATTAKDCLNGCHVAPSGQNDYCN